MRYVVKGDIKNVVHHLGNLHPEREFLVTIKPHRKNLTQNQRNYWHNILEILSNETGEDKETLKLRIKFAVLDLKEIRVNGVSHLYPPSSENLNREEYSKLIEATITLGAELGIILPSPNFWGME